MAKKEDLSSLLASLAGSKADTKNLTIRLKNWTLRTNSPLVTTEASLEHTWINSYPTMDNISQGLHPSLHVTNPNYNP
ncbi:hypothetical protein PGTUg99_029740 [Puccinia graminis f. sp. tritici]|uniref:Uncharacterized protein n=1 Tax=Puccinia graminis f. sp. tritici TaxID=56615 RepID=A0A5B0PJP0_PUCGR|nr:hypothetical protein PGTUg99_029740 [Puccinia graminis f. sp. tritici]